MEKGERGEGVFVRVCHSIINFSTEFLCDGHKRKKASDTYLGASTVAPAAAVCLFFYPVCGPHKRQLALGTHFKLHLKSGMKAQTCTRVC